MPQPPVLVLLSGGLDSTVLLADQLHQHRPAEAVSFDYGQRHARELDAAAAVAAHYTVPHHVMRLPDLGRHLTSALTGHSPVPSGEYDSRTMAATVVPNRNAVLISAAAGLAAARGLAAVLTAMHAGDHALYADCTPGFIAAIDLATYLACGVRVRAPYGGWTKTQVVARGRLLNAPLDLTWSCYVGGDQPCRQCGTCLERQAALA